MSFLDTYVKKYRLDKIDDSVKKHLLKVEDKLNKVTAKIQKGMSFADIVKEHGERIADLIERVSSYFSDWMPTWKNVFSSLKFVISISIEVFQIVESVKEAIITPDMSPEEAREALTKFGIDLVWFIWLIVNPLKSTLRWVPFKKTIEKWAVKRMARTGLEAALNLFKANQEVATFATKDTAGFMKAL